MNMQELMMLQGIDPTKCVVAGTVAQLGQQISNAMSVNVVERILVRALVAAGLTRSSSMKGTRSTQNYDDRWEDGAAFEESTN